MQQLDDIVDFGLLVSPRGLNTHEGSVDFWLHHNYYYVRKQFNEKLALAEGLGIIAGYTPWEVYELVAPKTYEHFYKDNTSVDYANMIGNRLEQCLDMLREDYMTRQATVFVGDNFSGLTPCPSYVQYVIRNGKLVSHVLHRSWDIYRGLPYDCYLWSVVSQAMQAELGLRSRSNHFVSFAAHWYLADKRPLYNLETVPQIFHPGKPMQERAKECLKSMLEISKTGHDFTVTELLSIQV